jgi:hypothetical protein
MEDTTFRAGSSIVATTYPLYGFGTPDPATSWAGWLYAIDADTGRGRGG